MIKKVFNIPIYDVKLSIIQIEKKDIWDKFKRCIPRFDDSLMEELEDNVTRADEVYNGGWTIFNRGRKELLVIFTEFNSDINRNAIVAHEKRHCEDDILKLCGIDDDEASAYLAQYLDKKFDWVRKLKTNIQHGNKSRKKV